METNWYQFIALSLWNIACMLGAWYFGIVRGGTSISVEMLTAILKNQDADNGKLIGRKVKIIFDGELRNAIVTKVKITEHEYGNKLDSVSVKLVDPNRYPYELEIWNRLIMWDKQ